jgi:hypothetical protein
LNNNNRTAAGNAIGISGNSSMTKKYFISFIIFTGLLILSEYYLLQEIYDRQRISIILISCTGVAVSIIFFGLFFKKYRRAGK